VPSRRLLAMAAIMRGATRMGHVMPQSVGEWVAGFNTAGSDGLVSLKAPGNARHKVIRAPSFRDRPPDDY
jgi:hypothetical protein